MEATGRYQAKKSYNFKVMYVFNLSLAQGNKILMELNFYARLQHGSISTVTLSENISARKYRPSPYHPLTSMF